MSELVVHCKRAKYDIYIGRPSILGNPFSHKAGTLAKYKVANVQEAIDCFRAYAEARMEQDTVYVAAIRACRGKVLGCWCKIEGDEPCHGDVIVELAENLARSDFGEVG